MSTAARLAPPCSARRRRALLGSCAVAAMALLSLAPRAASAQGFQGVPTFTSGNGSVMETATTTTVTIDEVQTIIDWAPLDSVGTGNVDFLPAGHLGEFQNGPNITDYVVLNRVLPTDPSRAIEFNGIVTSRILTLGVPAPGGAIWFYSPGGIVVGTDGVFDVGSLLLTTSDPAVSSGTFIDATGAFALTGAAGSIASVVNNGSLTAGAQNGYLVMVAPRVQQSGTASVEGSAAYVAAESVQMRIAGGLFDIAMTAPTSVQGDVIVHDGTTTLLNSGLTGPTARTAVLATVAKNDAVTMLLSGSINYEAAAGAEVVDNRIVLAAGYNVLGGEASSQVGLPQRANISITGQNFDPSVIGTATGTATVAAAAPMTFGGDLLLTAPGGAAMTAAAGSAIEVGGDLLLNANGNQTDPQGNASIAAAAGSTIDVAGDAIVTAELTGTGSVDVTSARTAEIGSDGGAISITGSATVSADAFGGNGTIPPGGAAVAGTAAIRTAGAGGSVSVGGQTAVTAIGRGGTSFVDGGAGTGGTARIATEGGAISLAGTVTVDASGAGGNGEGAGGTGGAGRGGTAEYAVSNATNLASLTVAADGTGGEPGSSGSTGGAGGAGTGGTATIRFGTAPNTIAALTLHARGAGGNAPGRTGTPPGTGGAGTGGTASLLGGSGATTITDAIVDAHGLGGVGGLGVDDAALATGPVTGGTGGAGTGGTLILASAPAGSLNIGTGAFTATGTGGAGGAGSEIGAGPTGGTGGTGGEGTGGDIRAETRGGTLAFSGAAGLTLSPLGIGGAGGNGGSGGSTGAGGAGGNGGSGRGGSGALDIAGRSASAASLAISAVGIGGAAGAGGVDAFGTQAPDGQGGAGYGGLARLSVADVGSLAGSASLGDTSLTASGVGIGSAASFAGTVRILETAAAEGGSLAMNSLSVEAGGAAPAPGHIGFELTTAHGPISVTNQADVNVSGSASLSGTGSGSLSAGAGIGVTTTEAITLAQADAPAGAPLLKGGDVTLAAGTSIAGATAAIVSEFDTILTAPGSIEVGSITAGDDIQVDAGTTATLGTVVTTGTGSGGEGGGGSADVTVDAGGGIVVASADAAGNIALTSTGAGVTSSGSLAADSDLDISAAGNVALASAEAGDDLGIATTGTTSAALLRTTGASDPLGGEANVTVHSEGGIAVQAIDAAGAVDLRAVAGNVLVSQDLSAAGPVDALGRNIDLTAQGLLPLASAVATDGNVDVDAGFLAISGPVRGTAISLASQDIDVGSAASVGTLGETQTLSVVANVFGGEAGPGVALIGGEPGDGNGYRLDNGEFSRLAARDISIVTGGGDDGGGDMIVGELTARGPGAANANLGRRLTLVAGGEIDVVGLVSIQGATDGSSIGIGAAGELHIEPAAGGVKVLAAGGALAGTIDLQGSSIVVASEQAVADLAGMATIAERNQRLGTNDGDADFGGRIQAGGVTLAAGESILVQNSGANALVPGTFNPPDNRAGITVGAGGLALVTLGQNVEIIVNGRQENGSGGFFTGTALIPRVQLGGPQSPASFAAGSTINGCPIVGSCIRTDLFEVPGDRDIIDEIPDETRLPGLTIDRLISAEGSSALDVIDEPVTGAGNDDLWIFFGQDEEDEEEEESEAPTDGAG